MKTCLFVDDSEIIRRVARALLESQKFEVSEADGGQPALDQARARMPDLVVLDWQMPGLPTLDVIKAMRALPGGDRPFILYLTTENDSVDISRAIAAGANDYLMKPFNRDVIEKKLAEIRAIG